LLTNLTALEELHAVLAEAPEELPEDRRRALGLYLAFALDKACDYNGILSTWDPTRARVKHAFVRHDFSFKWTFAELDGASALIPWAVDQVAGAYQGIARLVWQEGSLIEAERAASAQ